MVDIKDPILIIHSVAIHQNNDSNINLDLNKQKDLQLIFGLSKDKKTWLELLKKWIEGEIVDYDLFAYNIDKPIFIGINNELLVSPRIDNITSVYASLKGFLDEKSDNIKILI